VAAGSICTDTGFRTHLLRFEAGAVFCRTLALVGDREQPDTTKPMVIEKMAGEA
jgi:hypothetical protein